MLRRHRHLYESGDEDGVSHTTAVDFCLTGSPLTPLIEYCHFALDRHMHTELPKLPNEVTARVHFPSVPVAAGSPVCCGSLGTILSIKTGYYTQDFTASFP
ncbi:hypothetical protein E2C01_001399 [Portunus trituberculatus]|uniref:Uncharacterized protein n=1 Tax=Portunus trituberculatus TaxID=210409 RepID=A0A5B7CKB8_PORTR|nr:hypothetical protein [Portunus trituberculatus]